MQEKRVKDIFNSISGKYDITNLLLSFGIEKYWRKRFNSFIKGTERRILDACCGTGMSTFSILEKTPKGSQNGTEIYGIDFSKEMLEVAEKRLIKAGRLNSIPRINFSESDAADTAFDNNFFDLITVVFGLRNIIDRGKAIKEFYRITAPGGSLLIMEFNFPERGVFSKFYRFYLTRILANAGRIITGKRSAYQHLADSIMEFPNPHIIVKSLKEAGWKSITLQSMTFNTCNIYCASK